MMSFLENVFLRTAAEFWTRTWVPACRSGEMLKHTSFIAKFRFDTFENGLSKVANLVSFSDSEELMMNKVSPKIGMASTSLAGS